MWKLKSILKGRIDTWIISVLSHIFKIFRSFMTAGVFFT